MGNIIIKTFPGKHEPNGVFERSLYNQMLRFMGAVSGKCADIGATNTKMEYIKYWLGVDVDQVNDYDFNYCVFKGGYDVVFCFEVIEHLQNPLHFMGQLCNLIKNDGVIYLTTPGRPRFLWGKAHFLEMPPKHITKWIFEPLGVRVLRKKRLYVPFKWWFYFTGIRPFLRLFLNTKWIYELKKCG